MTMINYTVVTIDFTAAKVRHYGKIEFEVTTGLRTNLIFLLHIIERAPVTSALHPREPRLVDPRGRDLGRARLTISAIIAKLAQESET